MAVRLVAAAACLAAVTGGCVIREIREIRTEPAAATAVPSCAAGASGVPGSVLADTQPPAPMVEDGGEPPGEGYVWIDGYWHWNGAEWIWIGGRWVAQMADFVFVPPAYYTSGEACVYVPGYWQRGPRSPYPVRDHRPISIGGHYHHPRPHKPHHHIGDHRGDKPSGKTGSLAGVGDDQDEVVVTIPDRPPPVPAAPPTAKPTSPTWRPPGASTAPPSAPPRPSAPPPPQARPAPPPSPPRASPGPARVAPPSAPPARTAPPAPSPPPKPAAPPRPAQSPPAGGKKK